MLLETFERLIKRFVIILATIITFVLKLIIVPYSFIGVYIIGAWAYQNTSINFTIIITSLFLIGNIIGFYGIYQRTLNYQQVPAYTFDSQGTLMKIKRTIKLN